MIRATILGATGYTGGELLRILLRHPAVRVQRVTSESSPGKPVHAIHPDLRCLTPLVFEKADPAAATSDSDVVFSCLPHAAGIPLVRALYSAGVRVIDLSADFRLPSPALYRRWYKIRHGAPGLLKKAVYGLTELFRERVRGAALIANPGCYTTAAILSAVPLLKAGLAEGRGIIVDAKSGVSGAGKKVALETTFSEVNEDMRAYAVASHRHQPEIETVLTSFSGRRTEVTFTPHLVPMTRGMLTVSYLTLKKNITIKALRNLYAEFYGAEPFVRLLPEGESPNTRSVLRSNFCDMGVFHDPRFRRAIVVAAIDNLGKGAAGQAVQNMNVCFGRPETEGLR